MTHLETRLREAQRIGFDRAIIPQQNLKNINPKDYSTLQIIGVRYLKDAIAAIRQAGC